MKIKLLITYKEAPLDPIVREYNSEIPLPNIGDTVLAVTWINGNAKVGGEVIARYFTYEEGTITVGLQLK